MSYCSKNTRKAIFLSLSTGYKTLWSCIRWWFCDISVLVRKGIVWICLNLITWCSFSFLYICLNFCLWQWWCHRQLFAKLKMWLQLSSQSSLAPLNFASVVKSLLLGLKEWTCSFKVIVQCMQKQDKCSCVTNSIDTVQCKIGSTSIYVFQLLL